MAFLTTLLDTVSFILTMKRLQFVLSLIVLLQQPLLSMLCFMH